MRNKIALLIIILAGVLTINVAYADISQTSDSSTATPNTTALGTSYSGGQAAKGQRLGTGLSGTIATTTIYLSDSGGLGAITPAVSIECYDDSSYTTYNASCSTGKVTLPAENGAGKTLVSASTPLTLNSSKYYRLGIGCSSGCSGGTNPNLVTYGTTSDLYSSGDFSSGLTIVDVYFQLTGAFPPDSIAITYPANGTSHTDPDIFYGTMGISATSSIRSQYNDGIIKVRYGRSSSTWEYEDTTNFNNFDATTWAVPKNHISTASTTIWAIANVGWFDYDLGFDNPRYHGTATSTIISFNVISPDFSAEEDACGGFPAATSSSSFLNAVSLANLEHGGCVLLRGLFVPLSSTLALFTSLRDQVSAKPPFGYVSAVNTILASSSFAGGTNQLNISTDVGDEALFEVVNFAIRTILWAAFGFWVFHRFRHWDFHV